MDDSTLLGRMNRWWSKPFNTQGSALQWVLFVGVIIIAAFLWQLVLIEITKEIA